MDTPKTPKAKKPLPTRIDANGQSIPTSIIRPEILKQDAIVTKTINRAIKLHDRMVADKNQFFEDVELYLQQVAEKNGLDWKGNAVLNSFDGKYRVEIRFKERIQFGIELQLAKQKIDECLKSIAKYRILRLRRYNIKDQTWKEAMELIDQAIQVVSTKQYINFYERDESGQFRQIVLNFPAL